MTIKFKATKHILPFILSAILIGGVILCSILILINYKSQGIGRGVTIGVGTLIGTIVYFIFLKLIREVVSKDYCMEFTNSKITIKSKTHRKNISYKDVQKFIIWNNGDYAKIIINKSMGKEKYFIGLANLQFKTILGKKNNFCILKSFVEMDNLFSENGFQKIADENSQKQVELCTIEYQNIRTVE